MGHLRYTAFYRVIHKVCPRVSHKGKSKYWDQINKRLWCTRMASLTLIIWTLERASEDSRRLPNPKSSNLRSYITSPRNNTYKNALPIEDQNRQMICHRNTPRSPRPHYQKSISRSLPEDLTRPSKLPSRSQRENMTAKFPPQPRLAPSSRTLWDWAVAMRWQTSRMRL